MSFINYIRELKLKIVCGLRKLKKMVVVKRQNNIVYLPKIRNVSLLFKKDIEIVVNFFLCIHLEDIFKFIPVVILCFGFSLGIIKFFLS